MKKIISALLLLTSCTHGLEPLAVAEIEFSPSFTVEVKGTSLNEGLLMDKGFGVFAATGKKGTESGSMFENDNTLKPFMENVPVRYQNNQWTSVPKYYWPDGYDVSFFAYAPYVEEKDGYFESEVDWTSTDESKPRAVSLTYTPGVSPKDHIDLLVAKEQQLDKYREQVDFDFEHVLAKVTFSVAYTHGDEWPTAIPTSTKIRVDELEISGLLKTNTVILASNGYSWGQGTATGAVYKLSRLVGDLGGDLDPNKLDKDTYLDIVSSQGEMYLLPQQITSGTASVGVTFSFIGYKDDGTEYILAQFYSAKPIDRACTLEASTITRFALKLDIGSATLIGIDPQVEGWVDPWKDSTSDDHEVPGSVIK